LEDKRDRPAEFNAQGGVSGAELLVTLGATMGHASQVLSRLTEVELVAPFEIQGYHVTGSRCDLPGRGTFGEPHGPKPGGF
jgi:hypothetical protein